MKGKLLIGAVSAAIILGGAVAAGATKNDNTKSELQKNELQQTEQKMISHDEAVKIALTKAEGNVKSVELESKMGKSYYDVEIKNGVKEVEVHVDSLKGTVLSVKEDQDVNDNDNFEKQAQSNQKVSISTQKAIEIAEKAVNGKVTEIDRDDDDNELIYEIELQTSKGEVDVDIDAVSGKVLNVKYDD
ncbi:PepSY domain-containing protein [Cytobacillus depressus]|nr:PepSY domain-containing protein [Cytobacillus depressus]